jgi:tetratricopeptide (TPR) repeat protein
MELDPYNAYVCHALSNLERRLRNFDRAKEVLEKVVRNRPTSAICVSLSELERQLGSPESAKAILLHGLKKCNQERSKLLLALAWLEEDAFCNQNEATKLISEAIKIDANNVRVYVAKASMELRLQRKEDARKTLRHCISLPSDDGQHFTMLGTLELEMGNIVEAKRVLEEGSHRFPGDKFLLQRWGTVEAKFGNVDKARQLFEKSVLIQPHAPTFVAWAILEEQEGLKLTRQKIPILFTENEKSTKDKIFQIEGDQNSCITDLGASVPTSNFNGLSTDDLEVLFPFELRSSTTNGKESREFNPILDVPPRDVPSETAKVVADEQFLKARYLFNLGTTVDPQHGPLYHAHGNMEIRHNNISGARDIFAKGISMNCSDITSIFHAWGLLELREGRIEEASKIFRQGIEIGLKGNREVENGVSFLLHSLGMLELVESHRVEEAEKIFSTGVSLFPKHSHMHLGLAMSLMRLGMDEKAREYFRAAVDADPYHAHAWQAWAIAEKQCSHIELARALFRQGLKNNPTHGALWQAFAVMEMHQNNYEVARSLFSQALIRCPGHAQSYQAWACLEVRLGNLKKAKSLALHGIKLTPDHPALWTVAGLIEDRLGDSSRARHIFQRGIERFPR